MGSGVVLDRCPSLAPWRLGRRRRRRRATTAAVLIAVAGSALVCPVSAVAQPAARPGWTTQFVSQAGNADDYTASRTSISVSPTGTATILYCDGVNAQSGFDLRWARGPRADGTFRRESIDPTDPLITGNASLAVGPKGASYVSYVTGVYGDQGVLRFASRIGGTWSTETVDPQKSTMDTAIALGAEGQPVIAYTKTDGQVRLATHTAIGWTTSLVAQEGVQQPVAIDLAINQEGLPEIAYIAWDGTSYVAKLVTYDGSAWRIETVGHVSSQSMEFGVALVVSATDKPLLVFTVLDPVQGLKFAHRTSTGWKLQRIAAGDLRQPNAALDPTGHLHVTWYGATAGALRYAERFNGNWTPSTIADSPSPSIRIGRQSSIAFDATGMAHVAYYVGKETNGTTLHYAVSTPS